MAVLLVSSARAQTAGPEAADFESGRKQFHRTCAQCHGLNMVNSGVTVYDLRKFPLDQPERFFTALANGKGSMPSFRDALTEEQMRFLWAYVSRRGKPPQ
ncbi:MAG TPA: c-type cytochrome [Burkholderiales bacterium]|nr:c-type cytochrome [Burkholderiales bacterium]